MCSSLIQDTVLLSDFGIATIAHYTSSMRTSNYAGTAAYTAPEQLMGKPVPASDQYALAIMVYEWLCGALPYQGAPHEVGMQHLMAPIPSLLELNNTLPPQIEAVVHQAMAKDPKLRFATIVDFADALEQAHRSDIAPSSPSIEGYTATVLAPAQQTKKQLFDQGNAQTSPSNDRARFDKFTERAQKVLSLAQEEAQRFQHNYIGTEHLLLGLVREDDGVAAKVLANLGVELNKVRSAVEFIIGRGDRIVLGEKGLTPRAKKVIELAVDEARRLNHHYIGTEHLLLALVREGSGIAAGVLASLGINLEKVRTQTIQVLNQSPTPILNQPATPIRSQPARPVALKEAINDLASVLREREAAIQKQEYELAAELRNREVKLRDRITKLENDWRREQN